MVTSTEGLNGGVAMPMAVPSLHAISVAGRDMMRMTLKRRLGKKARYAAMMKEAGSVKDNATDFNGNIVNDAGESDSIMEQIHDIDGIVGIDAIPSEGLSVNENGLDGSMNDDVWASAETADEGVVMYDETMYEYNPGTDDVDEEDVVVVDEGPMDGNEADGSDEATNDPKKPEPWEIAIMVALVPVKSSYEERKVKRSSARFSRRVKTQAGDLPQWKRKILHGSDKYDFHTISRKDKFGTILDDINEMDESLEDWA